MPVPTGQVIEDENGSGQASQQIDGNGAFSFTRTAGNPGSLPIDVRYAGDAGHNPSQSPTVSLQITPAVVPTTVSITVSPNPVVSGQPFTVTGTVNNG